MKSPIECLRCKDRLVFGATGLCRPCFDARRDERAIRCIDCGAKVRSRSCKRCSDCGAKDKAARDALRANGRKCDGCGTRISAGSTSGVCRTCASRAAAARYAELRGLPPTDYAFLDAAKVGRRPKVKKCGECGGKYNTKACVACAVKERAKR